MISYVDGEDVSDFVEISVWVPDADADFDEVEDIYTWSNFEEEESSKDADDVSIDLSGVTYAWLEIDPDGESVFANDHILIRGGRNYDYAQYVYHQSSDIYFGAKNQTYGETWGNFTAPGMELNIPYGCSTGPVAGPATGVINDTISLFIDAPRCVEVPGEIANMHVGTNWDIEQSEYDEMSAAEINFTQDEGNWRVQAPTYNPALDLEKEGDDGLEAITNGFCIRWTYNTTVSTTELTETNVNMTISDNTNAEVVIDGTFIYIIFYDVIDFEDGPVCVEFKYEEAHMIYATAVEAGRVTVPRDEDALGAFVAISNIGT